MEKKTITLDEGKDAAIRFIMDLCDAIRNLQRENEDLKKQLEATVKE